MLRAKALANKKGGSRFTSSGTRGACDKCLICIEALKVCKLGFRGSSL